MTPRWARRLAHGLTPALTAAALVGCAASVPAPVLLTLPPAVTSVPTATPSDGAAATGSPLLAPGAPVAAQGGSGTSPGAASGAASAPSLAITTSPATVPTPRLIAVRRVGVPEYLLARRVRFRADASTVAEWPNTFWAERIEVGATRELVAALRAQLPGWGVCEASCGDAVPAVVVQADWSPLDYQRGARRLDAHARIVLSGGGAAAPVLAVREFAWTIPASADTPQAQAEALTEATRRLAAATAPLLAAAVQQP